MRRSKSSYVIQTVANAFELLEQFGGEDAELGVTELSDRLELPKNNVFRLLATLEQHGYIEQCAERDRYRLGRACLGLGQAFGETRSLVRFARPVLAKLTSQTNSEGERIDYAYGSDALASATQVGPGTPVHRFAYEGRDGAGLYHTRFWTPLGEERRYAYDGLGRLHERHDLASGERTTWTWSGQRIATHSAPNGATTAWSWSGETPKREGWATWLNQTKSWPPAPRQSARWRS